MKRWIRSPWALALALPLGLVLFAGPHRPDLQMQATLAEAMAVQASVADDWLALDGVVGTAVGRDASGRVAVKVYLESPGVAMLPRFVAGVPVDVEVTGPILALDRADAGAESVDPKRGFPRPVPIGVSTGHPDVTAGTIGARVTDGHRVFALSNNHVAANNNGARPGDPLLQPGVVDGGRAPDDAIGELHDFERIQFCSGVLCPANRIDAAIALTTTDDLGFETPEDGYGGPRGSSAEAELGMVVQKYGRTTGYTQGRVTGINAVIDVGYRDGKARFVDQVVITGNGFSAGGDSGSLIVSKGLLLNDRRPVGLLFAGSATSTIANPIDLVLDHFGVSVDGG